MSTSTRKGCPTCAFTWLDKYNKNECPKCLSPLVRGGSMKDVTKRPIDFNMGMPTPFKRAPGEASTYKLNPSDACESTSGKCNRNDGGPHHWKFGKCSMCGKGEGMELKAMMNANARRPGGACKDGRMHVFKFSKCTKCGKSEF